ncbi:MAG: CPBP family glutamic-type intramembrane protease [Lentimicrobiaceae bacterium]|nr:CPBP family glutamic-type intramembrane protease [Lentimicrobiaceae bacterium]
MTTNINKIFVFIILFSFSFGLLFGQKTLDHELFLEKIKHSSDTIYRDCIKEYDAYLEKFPDDVSVLVEKCKFIQYAQSDESEYYNPNQAAFDSCYADVINRFPTHPEVLLFQTTYLWGDELENVFNNAEKSIAENPTKWSNENLAALYKAMANHYYYQDNHKQALTYMEKAVSYDNQYGFSLEYARILLKLDRKTEALAVLTSIPDTAKETWELVQKAYLLLELKAYPEALDIYNQVEQMDSTYIDKSDLAATLEGMEQYELARKYRVADTSESYDKKGAILRLLKHDMQYQDGAKCIASYNALRDLGYLSDPIGFHRIKLFFLHPTLPWKFRDLLGIASLLALLAILIIIPYVWILPVYFAGKRFNFLSPKNVYEPHWGFKTFWFVSIGFLFASLFAYIVEPELLYSVFNSSGFNYETDMTLENKGIVTFVFIIIMAVFGLMAMYKVNPKVLLSSSWSISKSILTALGIFFAFKLISGIYILLGMKIFDISADDFAHIPNLLLISRQEIESVIGTFGKGTCILLIGFLGPIYEEIIFRGVVLDSCQRHINFRVANVLQALLFAIIHVNLFLLPVFFLFGILLGVLRKKSGGLLPCIVFHILNNVMALLVIFAR